MRFFIDEDIRKAATLPASFYQEPAVFEASKDQIFRKTWHWLGSERQLLTRDGFVHPLTLLPQVLDEPVVLSKDAKGDIRCLSNVCTHRGNLIAHNPGEAKQLRCMYHGRRFDLSGKFTFMPEFKEAEDFPRPCDHLPEFSVDKWHGFLFASLEPSFEMSEALKEVDKRVGFLPIEDFKFDAERSKEYLVAANWALYCDNYLEGFHIPFVHNDLNTALDYGSYETILFPHGNLQVGYGSDGTVVFDLPEGHIDHGKQVAAYYYWLFPNLMLNFYPWGLSVNIVRPISQHRTKVSFLSYVYDETKIEDGAGALLDKVEREDEFVVEGVQQGLKSKYYPGGRFSPTREQGVHQFHRMLATAIGEVPL